MNVIACFVDRGRNDNQLSSYTPSLFIPASARNSLSRESIAVQVRRP